MTGIILGLDLSTQQLKSVALNLNGEVVFVDSINFDEDLPQYKTVHGRHVKQNYEVSSPVLMWIEAIEMLLNKLSLMLGSATKDIVAICGGAQQHGSVYWKNFSIKSCQENFGNTGTPLADMLLHSNVFSQLESPTWEDSSTASECKELEDKIGVENLARITGSVAYERFTGNQIAKIKKRKSMVWRDTERISLISSFLSSVFLGYYAPIEVSDGSGMNLLDVQSKTWSSEICDEYLRLRLGPDPVLSGTELGRINEYFVKKYGFNKDCKICAFTGDNPASLLWFEGLSTKAQVNDKQTVVISLGTSDTLMFSLDSYPYSTEKSCDLSDSSARLGYTGHVLCHPVDPNRWAALLCYKNGSLTRDHICDRILNSIDHITQSDKWVAFEAAASSYTTTEDIFGFYYLMPEIIPKAQGIFRFRKINICSQDHLENSDSNNMNNILKLEEDQYIMEADVQDFGPLDAKLMLESQFVCMLLDCKKKGVETNHIDKIVVTGGASSNMLICQTISDVFGQNVYTSRLPNIEHSYADIDVLSKVSSYTVALGGIVSVCSQGEYQQHKDDVMSNFGLVLLSTPNPEKTQYYNSKLDSYDKLRSYLETNYPPN